MESTFENIIKNLSDQYNLNVVYKESVRPMKKYIWKILIAIGVIPLILPFILGCYHVWLESWTMGEWLILYSYVYWPTYVLGLVLIAVGIIKLKKGN